MNKYEEWIEEYKHLQGLHNQKKHGYRGGASVPAGGGNAKPAGGTKVSQAAQATGADRVEVPFTGFKVSFSAPTKSKIDPANIGTASGFLKEFMASTGIEPIAVTRTRDGFNVDLFAGQSTSGIEKRVKNALPPGYELSALKNKYDKEGRLPNGSRSGYQQAQIRKTAGTKVSQAAQATGTNPKFERHQNNVKKTTASVDSIDKSVSAPKPKADWADIGSASEVASQLNNIMEFAGLKAAKSPAPFGRNEKNTPEIRAQRYAAYQTKIKSDLAAIKKFLKAENKPTSKYINADDFGYINEQLGNIMEFLGG